MSDWDAEEELSEAERELAELELEYAGIMQGFKIASEKLEAINKFLEELKNYQYGIIHEMVIPRLEELLKGQPSGGSTP